MTNDQWGTVRGQACAGAGVYCLLLWLPRPHRIGPGRMGPCRLERGWYVYIGSARRNLLPRLLRHLRRHKRLHWHIDHLRAVASLRGIWVWPWTPGGECRTGALIRRMPGASVPVKGFGSTGCRCDAHLVSFRSEPLPPGPLAYVVRGSRIQAARRGGGAFLFSKADQGRRRTEGV
jgi:Uri superfamily endonuclease